MGKCECWASCGNGVGLELKAKFSASKKGPWKRRNNTNMEFLSLTIEFVENCMRLAFKTFKKKQLGDDCSLKLKWKGLFYYCKIVTIFENQGHMYKSFIKGWILKKILSKIFVDIWKTLNILKLYLIFPKEKSLWYHNNIHCLENGIQYQGRFFSFHFYFRNLSRNNSFTERFLFWWIYEFFKTCFTGKFLISSISDTATNV